MTLDDIIQYALVNPKMAKIKESIRYPGLFTIKYTKTAFFGQSWTPILEESRGLVFRAPTLELIAGGPSVYRWPAQIAVLPFRKIYNYGIDKESIVVPRDEFVNAYRKVNGFMIGVTRVPGIEELVFSTTGSLDSDFCQMARDVFRQTTLNSKFAASIEPGFTYLFECVHPEDPHIIPEEIGLHFLGRRAHDFEARVDNGADLRIQFEEAGCFIPSRMTIQMGDLLDMVKTVNHEGFVFYTIDGKSAKLKSPYYLAAKMFGRGKLDVLLNGRAKNFLDEELWPLVDHVKKNRENFETYDEQNRIAFCRGFLDRLYSTNPVGY